MGVQLDLEVDQPPDPSLRCGDPARITVSLEFCGLLQGYCLFFSSCLLSMCSTSAFLPAEF